MHIRVLPLNILKHNINILENKTIIEDLKKEVFEKYGANITIYFRMKYLNNNNFYDNTEPYIITMNENIEAVEYTNNILLYYLNS